MKFIVLFVSFGSILSGCCGGLECEEDPSAAYQEQMMERLCAEYTACNPDIDCDEFPGFDAGYDDCEFNIEAAQACLDGEFSCDTTVEWDALHIPDECGDAYGCIDY